MTLPTKLQKTYSKSEFKELILYLRKFVLPKVVKTGQPVFLSVTVKHKDLIFKPKRWVGELVETDIKNSKDNRDASIKPKSKKLPKKLEYVLRILATKSSFNFCPVGMMDDCMNLEAEDRGHAGTLMFCERDTKFPSSVWVKVRNVMEKYIDEPTKSTPNLILIYNSIKEKLSKKIAEFSINEILPNKLISEIGEKTVGIEIKIYPNRDFHVDEILGINTTEDTWITHQRAMKEVVKSLRRSPKMDEMLIEDIYGLVEADDYFLGNKDFFGKHSTITDKAECAEEEPLWLWVSSLVHRVDDLDKYRGFDCTDESKRKLQYTKAIQIYKKKNDWEKERDFILDIAKSNSYSNFETQIETIVHKLKEQQRGYTNVADLSVSKVDAALMFCLFVRDYIIEFGLNNTKENRVRIATLIFIKATELLKSKDVIENLIQSGTGAVGRYDNFFSVLWEILIEDKGESLGDVKQSLIINAIEFFNGTVLNPTADITIIDRVQNSRNRFVIKTINIPTGMGLDKGHKDSQLDESDINNFFLQFAGDNRYWSNTRTFDVNYSKEYIKDIKEFLNTNESNDDDWEEALANTKQFVKLWK
jgi:hypothetical protein